MLLPEKTREYAFPSTERDHPLYISIYSAACLRILVCLRRTNTLALDPAWESCIHQRGTPLSVSLLSQNIKVWALFQGQFSRQQKILAVNCTSAAANMGSSGINPCSH